MYVGDLKPDLEITCTDLVYNPTTGRRDPFAVDLSTASTVRIVGTLDDTTVIDRTLTGPYPSSGIITMPWQTGDTATAGDLRLYVVVTWPGAKPQTFPLDDFVEIRTRT